MSSEYIKKRNEEIINDYNYYTLQIEEKRLKYKDRLKLLSDNYFLSEKAIESIIFPPKKKKKKRKKRLILS